MHNIISHVDLVWHKCTVYITINVYIKKDKPNQMALCPYSTHYSEEGIRDEVRKKVFHRGWHERMFQKGGHLRGSFREVFQRDGY